MKITTIGIDLAKASFSVHGVDAHGKVMLRNTLGRAKLQIGASREVLEFFYSLNDAHNRRETVARSAAVERPCSCAG